MPITSIKRDSNSNVSIVRMISTDTLATIASANYIKNQMTVIKGLNDGNWQWFMTDVILCSASDANGFFQFTDTTFSTLVLIASDTDGTVTPGLANQIAIYPSNGTVLSGSSTLPSLVQATPANLNNGVGATANKFYAGDGTWKTVASATNHSIHTIFVAQDGNDLTGNGSINAPYASISHAIAVTTTASSLNIFNIICLYGIFTETSLTLKPFISINGAGSILNVTNDIDLDTSWGSLSPAGGTITVEGFQSVIISGNINLDFSVANANPCTFNLFDCNIYSLGGTFTITAGRYLMSNIYRASLQDITINNSSGYISQSFLANLTFNSTSALTSESFNLLDSNISGNASFNGNALALNANIEIYNTKIGSSLSADQANVALYVDSNSLSATSLPTSSNGATVNYINVSNTLNANYTPVNYTPDPTFGTFPLSSVAAHLHGIDNAFNSSENYSAFSIYVSPDGNDSTGTGSPTNPYQTIVHALSTITTNSSSNIFNIVLGGGVYNETSQINLKPWVNIVGFSRETIVNNSLDIILDTSWNGTTAGTIEIAQMSISNNLNIDFTSTSTADGPIVFIDNINVSGDFIVQGNAMNPCNFHVRNSMFNDTFIDNAVVFSFSNFYFLSFSSGTNPFIIASNYESLGDFYGNGLSLTGDTSGPLNQFFTIRSCLINPTLSITGANARVNIDVSSYINPTLSGSPTVNLGSISNGLSSNYSPTTYIPDISGTTGPFSNGVAAHLHGIDNALNAGIVNWTDVTGTTQNAAVSNGYVADNVLPVTINLPSTASFGQIISVQGNGSGGFVVVANTGQVINVDTNSTSAGGTVSSTGQYQSLDLICTVANTTWVARNFIGTFVFT